MHNIKDNLNKIRNNLPPNCTLVAVSKYHSTDSIMMCYEEGQRVFGESHVQELQNKRHELPEDIKWHFIGHLQTNKVKYIAPYITLIHAVDSVKLMQEINKQAQKSNRIIDILLELHIAQEESKYGFTLNECHDMLQSGIWNDMKNIRICGIMMMASNTDNEATITQEFDTAHKFYDDIKKEFFEGDTNFCYRSWGMSDDYHLAIKHGANIVRIGTTIFGER